MELRRVGGEIFSEIQYKTSSVSLTSQTVLRPHDPISRASCTNSSGEKQGLCHLAN